ncbi:hypothetical protein Dsin_010990 [Dipteronia sinensis]|uniref:Cytochrome P450 n=1 Tax=Dipteronia sinensis TaxID=43782 RepID=A0AAE0AUH9_9ROSI|nr:hypothetical protein Dsin_010990 [Dipteronia sinensis]
MKENILSRKFTNALVSAPASGSLFAGTDTTAEAMQWTIAELINHPDAFKKGQDLAIYKISTILISS